MKTPKGMRITNEERKGVYAKVEQVAEGKKHCWRTNKISYNTRKKAIKARSRALAQDPEQGKEFQRYVYKCNFCQQWHLTKQQQRGDGYRIDGRAKNLAAERDETDLPSHPSGDTLKLTTDQIWRK